MQQLCSAMQYAHNHDVVHGNIKPTNVLVAADGRMLLTDFGIARSYDDSQQSLTQVGWGSAEYIAPEQSLGIVRRTSDVYSLGVLLFRILTGFPPFTGQTPVEVLLKHVRQPAPSARSLVPNISDAVDGVLQTALQKRSEERFASVDELQQAFLTAVTVAPVASPVARAAAPRLTRALPVEDPQTPVPTHAMPGRVADPHTPVPPYVAFGPGSGVRPMPSIPSQEADAVPQEDFPQVSPMLPPSVSTRPLGPDEQESSDVTVVRKKNFLQETDDEQQSNTIFWSSDPPEWSPIGQEAPEDDKTEKINRANADVATDAAGVAEVAADVVPFTAEAYLHSKPLVKAAEPVQPMESAEPAHLESIPTEEDAPKQSLTFGERFKKWLPIIVVILLVLGLIGAILSAFFFPMDKPSAWIEDIIHLYT
jgi:serine/threonine protein kinase